MPISAYKTLCVDDSNEAQSTPSLKRLFSNHGEIVKQLLDMLNLDEDIKPQLERIVANSTVSKSNWRYYFIKFPALFRLISVSHLRLREVSNELLIIPNKSSNGHNFDAFLASLQDTLKQFNIDSYFEDILGIWSDRDLCVGNFKVQFKNSKCTIRDLMNVNVFATKTDDPIAEAVDFLR